MIVPHIINCVYDYPTTSCDVFCSWWYIESMQIKHVTYQNLKRRFRFTRDYRLFIPLVYSRRLLMQCFTSVAPYCRLNNTDKRIHADYCIKENGYYESYFMETLPTSARTHT